MLSSGRPKPIMTVGILRCRSRSPTDGDGSAGADEHGVLIQIFLRARVGLDVGIVGADDDGFAGMDEANVEFDAVGLERLDIGLVLGEGVLRILVGDEAIETVATAFAGMTVLAPAPVKSPGMP